MRAGSDIGVQRKPAKKKVEGEGNIAECDTFANSATKDGKGGRNSNRRSGVRTGRRRGWLNKGVPGPRGTQAGSEKETH